jgi:hypothetical protein
MVADCARLLEVATEQRWNEATPVPQQVFGELWPSGPPEGWPAGKDFVPRFWVRVAGDGSRALGLLPPNVYLTARRLGEALAEAGYGLIGAGWTGVDRVVAQNFAETLRRRGCSEADALQHVLQADREPDYPFRRRVFVAASAGPWCSPPIPRPKSARPCSR